MSGMFPVASFPCICYRTEDYHCVSVSVSHLFGLPQSRSIFAYEWPRLSVALTEPPQRLHACLAPPTIRAGTPRCEPAPSACTRPSLAPSPVFQPTSDVPGHPSHFRLSPQHPHRHSCTPRPVLAVPPCRHACRLCLCCHPCSSPLWHAVTLHQRLFHEGQHQLMLRGEHGGTEPGKCMFASLHLTAHMCHDRLIVFRGPMAHPLLCHSPQAPEGVSHL